MKSIQEALERVQIRPEQAHIAAPTPFLGRVTKKAFETYCRIVLSTYCPLAVRGREHLPNGSFILCSNHCSHMDSVVLMTASGRGFDKFGLIAAKDYFFTDHQKRNYLHYLMNLIPVERQSTRESIIEDLALFREFVRTQDRSLIIYPEGTRSRSGHIQPFKKGAAMISVELDLPIVPVHIRGTHRAWPKGKLFLRPQRLRVVFGAPLNPRDFHSGGNGDNGRNLIYRRITEALRERVVTLAEEA